MRSLHDISEFEGLQFILSFPSFMTSTNPPQGKYHFYLTAKNQTSNSSAYHQTIQQSDPAKTEL